MRQRTADIPLRTLRSPEPGALRSYATRGNVFVVSRILATKHSAAGAWRVVHQPSGASAPATSMSDAIALIRRLQSMPSEGGGASDRFAIIPRPAPMGGVVLFDRLTGRWFPRSANEPVSAIELDAMERLHASVVEWQMELELRRAMPPTPRTNEGETVIVTASPSIPSRAHA